MVDSPALVGTMNSICNKNEVFEIKLWLKTHKNEKKTRKIKIAKFSRNNAYTFRVFENEFESLFRSKAALKIENHTVTISKDNIILSSASLLLCLSPWNDDKKTWKAAFIWSRMKQLPEGSYFIWHWLYFWKLMAVTHGQSQNERLGRNRT